MNQYPILLATVFLGIITSTTGMESPRSLSDVREIVANAFNAFDLSSEEYSTNTYTPYDRVLWKVIGTHIDIPKPIRQNRELTEFAAYCAAAYVKNKGQTKSLAASMGSKLLYLALAPTITLLSANHPYHCYISLTALTATLVGIPMDIPKKIETAVNEHLDGKALADACEKLIARNNLGPLATLCAFAAGANYAPLGHEKQFSIIGAILARHNLYTQQTHLSNSITVDIMKNEDMLTTIKLISRTYPPVRAS